MTTLSTESYISKPNCGNADFKTMPYKGSLLGTKDANRALKQKLFHLFKIKIPLIYVYIRALEPQSLIEYRKQYKALLAPWHLVKRVHKV